MNRSRIITVILAVVVIIFITSIIVSKTQQTAPTSDHEPTTIPTATIAPTTITSNSSTDEIIPIRQPEFSVSNPDAYAMFAQAAIEQYVIYDSEETPESRAGRLAPYFAANSPALTQLPELGYAKWAGITGFHATVILLNTPSFPSIGENANTWSYAATVQCEATYTIPNGQILHYPTGMTWTLGLPKDSTDGKFTIIEEPPIALG